MKKLIKILSLILIIVIAGCDKNEEPEIIDNSLIITNYNSGKYVIVSPSTGVILDIVEPNVIFVNSLSLGYQSEKALIISKPESGVGMKVIYSCDRKTGDNLFKITSENDWDVLFFDGSPVSKQIVFSAQNADLLSDDNIHKINEDGSGYQRLSSLNEGIDCPSRNIATKLVAAYDPSWSPDGSKIIFDGHLREIEENHPHNSLIMMDANGENKQILYDVAVEETHYRDICWTQDGQFLVFLVNEGTEVKVKALNVETKTIVDITSHLEVEGLHTTNLWTSPNSNKIIFNKYEPGGGDLYEIDFTITNGQFEISGNYKMLSSQEGGHNFGVPDWQLWDGNN